MFREESWKKRFEQQSRSGLSIAQWCTRQGLRVNQYYYWHRRLVGTESDKGGESFVRLDAGSSEPVELHIGEQYRLRVPSNFDRTSLKSLLEVLGC